jgi:molybdopterin-guanine dinucleotide biosynthesis protein A
MAQKIGLVLAGGRGERLGRSKGDLVIDGLPLAQRAAEALFPHCGSVLISVAQGAANPAPDWPVIEDFPPPGRGPLAGIASAFAVSGDADLLVLACDYPNVDSTLMGLLAQAPLDEVDLLMPTDAAGRDHPLVASWSRRMQPIIDDALDAGRFRVQSLFPDCRVRRLPPDQLPLAGAAAPMLQKLHNVNFPTDLTGYRLD